MSKYIDTEELKRNFIISEGKGYITDEFKQQLIQIIESIMRKLNRPTLRALDSDVLCWAVLKDVSAFWLHAKKYDNVLPYFAELTICRPHCTAPIPFYIDWETGEEEKDNYKIIRCQLKEGFLPIMVKIYCKYNITNHKEIFSYYEKYIDNLPTESLETMTTLDIVEKNFIRDCIKYIRRDKIEKINSI